MNKVARGGTELMAARIEKVLGEELFSQVQIIHSRVHEEIDPDKPTILVMHDLAEDPENEHLRDNGWEKFDLIVFVSYWQKEQYERVWGIPANNTVVIRNFIDPIPAHEKPEDEFSFIYTSTPHRGLAIAYAAFEYLVKMCEENGSPIPKFKVFSSFDLYGWGERDEQHKDLFKVLEDHPHVVYSKSVPNEQIREELQNSHAFVLPSIWPETSCLALIEAMSANCWCIHSSLAALPETSLGGTVMYPLNPDVNYHALQCYMAMSSVYEEFLNNGPQDQAVSPYVDEVYGVDRGSLTWNMVVQRLLDLRNEER